MTTTVSDADRNAAEAAFGSFLRHDAPMKNRVEALAAFIAELKARMREEERERCARMFEEWPWTEDQQTAFEASGRGGPGDFYAQAIRGSGT